jgi:hypothetical protein
MKELGPAEFSAATGLSVKALRFVAMGFTSPWPEGAGRLHDQGDTNW